MAQHGTAWRANRYRGSSAHRRNHQPGSKPAHPMSRPRFPQISPLSGGRPRSADWPHHRTGSYSACPPSDDGSTNLF
ncbi:hypothetical protein C8034_v003854 [Colletotrichum sidae]|uniref:Uncharacterized protein n=1 Tax=Colletotrichum sidae TaxID=1347389 RepID=A0A4R8T9K9_9PEZI|nr:hypothetical protein C8034_v003854 [Colletotrichum sidae]